MKFDIVTGNPPYMGNKGNKEIFRGIKNSYLGKYYKGQMDLFYIFFHLGIDILKKGGLLNYITTSYFLTATGAVKLREHIKKDCNIVKFIDFNEVNIFENEKGQHNLITLLEKRNGNIRKCETVSVKESVADNSIGLVMLENKVISNQNDVFDDKTNYIYLYGLKGTKESEILNKISQGSVLLSDIALIKAGIGITVAKATKKYINNFPELNLKLNEGIFVVTKEESIKLEKDKVKSFVKNSDIQHYTYSLNKDKLIYLTKNDDLDNYPNLKKHMFRFKKILDDQIIKYEEFFTWYALHRPRTQDIFESSEKIIVPYRAKKNYFAFSTEPLYAGRDVLYILKNNKNISLKYLLGLLNSRLYYFWLYNRGKRKGNILELIAQPLSEIPIKIVSKDVQKPIELLVNEIIESKTLGKDTKDLEEHLNKLIYDLYGINQEEIQVIENCYSS